MKYKNYLFKQKHFVLISETFQTAMDERHRRPNGATIKLQISHFYRQIDWNESDDDEETSSFVKEDDDEESECIDNEECNDDDYQDDSDEVGSYHLKTMFDYEAVYIVDCTSTEILQAEKKWRKAYFGQPCNMKSPEKVSFDENITVYHLDDFGENRKSEWLEEVADRERFERRIAQCEAVLSTVLKRRLETQFHYFQN